MYKLSPSTDAVLLCIEGVLMYVVCIIDVILCSISTKCGCL